MKALQSLRRWWRDMLRKRRFSMLNATDNSEEWHVHISPAGILAAVVAFVLLLFILILTLAAYTPVMESLPGYRTEAERAREGLIKNIIRVDSMERMINDMLVYNQNIALIMDGKTPVVRSILPSDSTRTENATVKPSAEDSVLRSQMEGSGIYALSGRAGASKQSVREAIELAKPVEGIITEHFDIKNAKFGVSIAAAEGDRVTAVDNGTVVMSVWAPETGYIVELQHANNLLSVYKGLSQALIPVGQTVRAGDLIGYHAQAENDNVRLFEFELWNSGKPVDPESYIVF